MPQKPRPTALPQAAHSSFPITNVTPSQQSGQQEAIMHLKAGRLEEAAAIFERVIAENPENWQSTHLLGLVSYRQGQYERAVHFISQCLSINPDLAEAYSDLGVVLKDMGEFKNAQTACEKAIALKPGFHPAHSNLGNIFKAQNKYEDAERCYRQAIELSPEFVDAYANLGGTLIALGRTDEALEACLKAVELSPNHVEALMAFAHALRAAGERADAITVCRRAIELRPNYGPVYSDLGCVLQEDGQFEEAIKAHEKAIELKPDYAEAHSNLGIVFKDLGRYEDAVRCYKTAIELKPQYADAYSNLGVAFGLLQQHSEAVEAYKQAIELDPRHIIAYVNLAGALSEQDQIAEAISIYAKALTIEPDHPGALIDHYHLRRKVCDWDGLATAEEKILTSTYRDGVRIASFPVLNLPCGAEDHLLSARVWAEGLPRPVSQPFTYAPLRSQSLGERLRIGYLSGDFYRHATTNLIAELIERHDRGRFEVFGYCFSRDDGSQMRQRVVTAFDRFTPIGPMSHAEAAKRINEDGIDILIDLKGYTTDARTEILAARPAPIQVNYLGYPGTMGADFIDYIIADKFIAPMDQTPFFDEKIVHLPGCYQPNDTKRAVADHTPSRAECGLPETGFVFCSFNNSYKITPEIFALWMRLLQAVPGSVLWLLESAPQMRENLRRKAASLGIDPSRLVFAPKMDLSAHLARHRNADLFLDTLPVNAHTTASDALWAGLPVLTCAGETFVSRVCGSLLKAVDLDELITYSLEHYERTALSLAGNPEMLSKLCNRLAKAKLSAPLFDIQRYTTGLEAAFEHMAELHEKGEGPRAFSVCEEASGDDDAELLDESAIVSEGPAVDAPPAKSRISEALIPFENCPLCHSIEFEAFKTTNCADHPCYDPVLPSTNSWCRCPSCHHVFLSGHLAPHALNAYRAKLPQSQTSIEAADSQRMIWGRLVGQIAKLKPGGDWLDVMPADESLLTTAAEWGYQPVSTNASPSVTERLKRYSAEIQACPIEDLDMPGRFSVISVSAVLQRMPYPLVALTAAQRLLKPDGILFCSVPNRETGVWRMMDEVDENPYWSDIEHYHIFTRERFYELLRGQGFKPVFYNVSESQRSAMDVIATKI